MISAKTRSLVRARELARDLWDLRSRMKQEQSESDERGATKLAAGAAARASQTLTIEDAIGRWLNSRKGVGADASRNCRCAGNRNRLWGENNNIKNVAGVAVGQSR